MRIPAQASIAKIEQALLRADAAPNHERFKLPSNLSHLGCGGEAALSQMLVTWAQPRLPAILETFVESQEQIDEFVRRLPGLTGALCARVVMGGGASGDVTAQMRVAALARLDVLLSGKPKAAYRGSSVEIVCADHLGRNAPYLLYQPGRALAPRLRPRDSFASLAVWLLRQTVPDAYQALIAPETPDALGGMMFELFKNTQDHGQVDAFGNFLAMSIRAIKTLHHAIEPKRLAEIVADYPPFARYCELLISTRN